MTYSAAFPLLSVARELFGHALDLVFASQVRPVVVFLQFLTFLLLLWTGRKKRCPCLSPCRVTFINVRLRHSLVQCLQQVSSHCMLSDTHTAAQQWERLKFLSFVTVSCRLISFASGLWCGHATCRSVCKGRKSHLFWVCEFCLQFKRDLVPLLRLVLSRLALRYMKGWWSGSQHKQITACVLPSLPTNYVNLTLLLTSFQSVIVKLLQATIDFSLLIHIENQLSGTATSLVVLITVLLLFI